MPATAAPLPAAGAPLPAAAAAFWAGDASSARARRLSQLLAPLPAPSGSASSGSCGSSSGASMLRHYIDPWDLENYAYLRRRDADAGFCSSTPALESSQSDFSYVAGSLEAAAYVSGGGGASGASGAGSLMPYAAVDEEPFCNAALLSMQAPPPLRKTSSTLRRGHLQPRGPPPPLAHHHHHARRHSHAHQHAHEHTVYGRAGGELAMDEDSGSGSGSAGSGSGGGSGGDGSCRLYSPSLLVRRPPGDLVYVYGGRKLALPDVMGVADAPCCYSASDGASSADEDEEERCCYFPQPPPPPPPPRFALSRHGHLRLDYSCSWASLDRYIAAVD